MATVYSVLCDSPGEAERALSQLCDQLDLEPSGPPTEVVGRSKWMGRARPAPAAGDDRTPAP